MSRAMSPSSIRRLMPSRGIVMRYSVETEATGATGTCVAVAICDGVKAVGKIGDGRIIVADTGATGVATRSVTTRRRSAQTRREPLTGLPFACGRLRESGGAVVGPAPCASDHVQDHEDDPDKREDHDKALILSRRGRGK